MAHIKRINEFVNENANNTPDEQLFLGTLGFKDFEEIQRRYTRKWYSLSTYGGGERTYIPNIIPMRIIASAIGRYMKSNQSANIYCEPQPWGAHRLCFYVENNNKKIKISFEDGEITHYGEDMTEPKISVYHSGKYSIIRGDDRRKFGDTDWHENEMGRISDRLLRVLDDVL